MAFSSGAVTIGTTPSVVYDAGEDYPRLIVKNTHATNSVFLGSAGVTTTNGFELAAGATLTFGQMSDADDDLYAVAAVMSTVRYLAW